MTAPIFVDGVPANLEAAALDALAWLEFFRKHPSLGTLFNPAKSAEAVQRIDLAIGALAGLLPEDEPVFLSDEVVVEDAAALVHPPL